MKSYYCIPILALFLLFGIGMPKLAQSQSIVDFDGEPRINSGYGSIFGDSNPAPYPDEPSEIEIAKGFLFTISGGISNPTVSRLTGADGYDNGSSPSGYLYDNSSAAGDVTRWTIKKADGSNFRFMGIYLRRMYAGSSSSGAVIARKGGSEVGRVNNVNFDGTLNQSFANNPIFYDVDEIRIEAPDINIYLDHFMYDVPLVIGANDPAQVTSISLVGAPMTTATQVTYKVVFSKNVINVDIADFELSTGVGVTATLNPVTGSNDTYEIVVSNISGEGSLKLNLKAGTDIATVSGDYTGTPAYTNGQVHYVGSCLVENFDQGEAHNATTFSGNGISFTLEGNWTVKHFATPRGLGGSAYHLSNEGTTGNGTYKMTSSVPISIKGLYLFLSADASGDTLPIATGTVTLTGKRNGGTQYTLTKNSGFNTGFETNSGYTYIDFTTNGTTIVDELEISLSGAFVYMDLDNLNWCLDFSPPTGYAVQFDQANINGDNHQAVSFTSAGSEVGATYHYSISSSAGGTAVTGTGVISSANQQISGIDVSGLPVGTLTLSFYLTDESNNQGSPVTHQAIYTLNLPPVMTNLHGDSFGFTEGGNATLIDVGGNAVVTDIDSPDFGAGNLTVSITSNGENTDVLGIRNQGVGTGQIGVSGLNVTYGGVLIGSYTGGSNGTNLVVTFNNAANPANVSTLLRNLTFQNTSNDPSTASRNISVTIADGDGGTSTAAEITAVVTAVNNAPTLSATALNPTFTEGDATVALFSGANSSTIENGQKFTQLVLTASGVVDAANHEYLRIGTGDSHYTFGITSTPTNGITKTKDPVSGVITVTIDFPTPVTAAELNSWVNNFGYIHYGANPTPSPRVFTLTALQDDGGTANGGVDTRALSIVSTVTVVAVNDAPIITAPATIAVVEDVQTPLTGISFSDVDAGAAAVTATFSVPSGSLSAVSGSDVTVGGTASAVTLTGTIADINAFVASGNVAFTTAMNATVDVTLTVSINDNGNTGTGGSLSDSGTITLLVTAVNDAPVITAPATIAVDEDVQSQLMGISFSDVDAGAAAVTATFSVPSGSLSASSGSGVTIGGTTNAMTLSGAIANINTFIASGAVRFTTAMNATADVTLTVSINDNGNTGTGGDQTDTKTVTLSVTAINDPPVITAPATIAVVEDVQTPLTGISFSDVDAGAAAVTVTLSVPSGSLSAVSVSGVTVGGTASAATLTGTIADINTFVASGNIAFTTAMNATANVTLTVSINDNGNTGTGGSLSDSGTITLLVTAVNDAPELTAPTTQTIDQDETLIFHTADNNHIVVSDVDAGTSAIQLTLTAANGSLTLAGTTGLSFLVGSGANDATMIFEGTLADINNALDGLQFKPTAGYNGPASLSIAVNDKGASGSGGVLTDTKVISITVNPLNPTITGVSSSTANGLYGIGQTINIAVTFDQNVYVHGTDGRPTLLLETGLTDRNAIYDSGSGSKTLIFKYIVQEGDLSVDLDYNSTGALALNGVALRNNIGKDAILTLPSPAAAGSLGASKNIVIDGVRPVITLDIDGGALYTNNSNVTLTVNTADTDIATMSFSNDGTNYSTAEAFATNKAWELKPGDGLKTVYIQVVDHAGNASVVASDNITLDQTAPVVTGVSDGGVYNDDRTIGFNEGTATLNGASFNSGDVVSAEGDYTLVVTDAAGNVTTLSFAIDKTAPVVSGVSDGGIYNDDRTIGFNEGTATLNGTSFNSGDVVSAESDYTLVVTDAAGNVTTLSFAIDKTAPARPIGLTAAPSSGNISLEWTANQETDLASYYIYAGTSANQLSLLTIIPAGTTAYIDGLLSMGQRYYYAISAVDALGNESPRSAVADAMPQATQTITFGALADRIYGDAPFALTATASSGLSISYSSSDNNIASISGNVLTIHQVGDVEITASQNGNDAFLAAAPVTQSLHIHKATLSGVAIGDAVHTYDGTVKSLEISGTLPNGVTVSYDNNEQVNAGTYIVTANIDGGTNYEDQTLSATMTIEKADLTGITLTDATHTYDGTAKSLTIAGTLPNGVTVSYDNNGQVNAGTYIVTANIDGGTNYEDQTLSATLTIEKADLTGITLTDATYTYDGTAKSLAVAGTLPAGVTVTYANNGQVNAGAYTVTANMDGGTNFEDQTLTAELTIEKAVITGITLEDATYTYDGTAKSLAVVGTLSNGVTVSYTNNGQVNAGTYIVTANIDGGTNYEGQTLRATLTIEKADLTAITLTDATYTYDGTAKSLTIAGTLPNGIVVVYDNNGQIDVGEYTVTATIAETENHTGLRLQALLTIRKASQTITFTSPGTLARDAGSVALDVRSDSDLPVVLSVDDDMVARINGTNLEVLRLGTVVITATQVGSENYEAAEPVSVTVRVANDANAPLPIRVHQAVSPNGDGINEFLIMEGIRDYPENKVTIFDKSGKVIEVIEGYNNGDRVFTGQFVNDGTYYYYIDVKDGGVWKREKGFFVVKRSVN